jgi:hypothetical protein
MIEFCYEADDRLVTEHGEQDPTMHFSITLLNATSLHLGCCCFIFRLWLDFWKLKAFCSVDAKNLNADQVFVMET